MPDPSKTEKATPKKRRDERKKGRWPLSRDIVAVATLAGAAALLRLTFRSAVRELSAFMTFCFTRAEGTLPTQIPRELLFRAIVLVARICGPLLAAAILLTVIATFAQTRMLVAFESIKPKFDKLNPINGFKNLFSLRSVIELLKGLIKIVVLFFLIYTSLRDHIAEAQRYMYADLASACIHLLRGIFTMIMKVVVAFLFVAVLDYAYQRWDYEREMRMTKDEIKEEYKQTEGDPKVKARIKEIQRKSAMQRMMAQVPNADVIIRNPTHVAVALRYRSGQDAAPVVLAKGLDSLAQRIVDRAEECDIIVIENVPLARALYAEVELNQQIPASLYEAVAEVMVYLYKLGRIQA